MAGAPTKQGRFTFIQRATLLNEKTEQLLAEHPAKGYEVYNRLLDRLYYTDHGYFIEWNERQGRYMARQCATTYEVTEPIIQTALREGLFSPEMYDKFHILTSLEIQTTFLHAQSNRRKTHVIRDFALFPPEYIEDMKLEKRAFFCFYDNISLLFQDNGIVHPDWLKMATRTELIVPPKLTESKNADPPLEPVGPDGRQYGDPQPLPPNFDWEAEKLLLKGDQEWKQVACTRYNIGLWSGLDFKPDYKTLDTWLEDFFQQLVVRGDKKTARMMKTHFDNWFPKREAGGKISTLKTNLHVGKQDYENQTTWGRKSKS